MKGDNYEVDSNRVEEVLIEWVLGVAQQQATFAHTAVADEQHFKEVVAKQKLGRDSAKVTLTILDWSPSSSFLTLLN